MSPRRELPIDPDLEFSLVDPRSPPASELVGLLFAEMIRLYPDEDPGVFAATDFAPPSGVFLVVMRGPRPAGCGAFRRFDDQTAELKHMYVALPERGRGLARAILRHLERHASKARYEKLRMETGLRQPAAIRIYRSEGYDSIDCYGQFVGNPFSVCFEKRLR